MRTIGFMQGRLSPLVDGWIQAFPWDHWRTEIDVAVRNGFRLMEWTLDQDRLYGNPLMTAAGQAEIRALCGREGFAIGSLTGDCWMQAPFWKRRGNERAALQRDFRAIAEACAAVGISLLVVPLVDAGRLEDRGQEDDLVDFLSDHGAFLGQRGLRVVFEIDYQPRDTARFLGRLDPARFGINYDIGNSASLGLNPVEEFAAFGDRVYNVHVKDRVLGGTTVPLGTGNAKFEHVFSLLARAGYRGNFILQTARAQDGGHLEALLRYRKMTADWLIRYAP